MAKTPKPEKRSKRSTATGEMHAIDDHRIVNKFIADNDVPGWYRGLSQFQFDAAHQLYGALRDDAEQNTAHRVIECVNLLGLRPGISKSSAKFLMRVSRCNDLAFLWFLMDVQYKKNDSDYSLNEQIIMSCIAALDMVTTMRALDQILPPPQPTKKELERQRRKRQRKKIAPEQSTIDLMRSRHRPKYSLPYFIPLERPQSFGKSLTSSPLDLRMNFGMFEDYANQNYVVQNESNRWYANYEIRPTRRIAESVKNELLNRILARINADDIATRHGRTTFSLDANATDAEPKNEQLEPKSMCENHRLIDELEKSLEHELKVIARDRCLKYFDVVTSKKEATRKRIQEQLEHDVTLYKEQFRRLADSTRKSVSHVHLVTKNDFCEYSPDVVNKENTCPSPKGRCARPHGCCKSRCEQGKKVEPAGDGPKLETPVGDCQRRSPLQQWKHNEGHNNTIGDGPGAATQRIRKITRGGACDCGYEYVKSYDYGHSEQRSRSSTFFAAPAEHQPYRFDYHKIFDLKENEQDDCDTACDIRRTCLKAVDSDACLEDMDPLKPLDMDGAVKKTAKKIFQKQVANHQQKVEEKERVRMKNRKTPLDYHETYYDPDDTPLMKRMLKDALALLSKDPKYVLASMPDAYKHPILRFWLYRRFGKVFSRAERDKSWHKSARIFHSLYKMTLDVMLPSARKLGPALYVDYSCRNYILQRSKHIREVYYKHLDSAFMEQSRALYLAMAPFMCGGGPPRKTYFAYMPPRTMDIHHFHVWKPNEYIDYKGAHDSRMARKARDATLQMDSISRL